MEINFNEIENLDNIDNNNSCNAINGVTIKLETLKINTKEDHNLLHFNEEDSKKCLIPIEKQIREKNLNISINQLLKLSYNLIKTNNTYLWLLFLLFLWVIPTAFELTYGLLYNEVDIVSDSFFNMFKTLPIIFVCLSLLISEIFLSRTNDFLNTRIELLAALANCVFLVIISVYMTLQALHMITEDIDINEQLREINPFAVFQRIFLIIKLILDLFSLYIFRDYLLHPSTKLKWNSLAKTKKWRKLEDFEFNDIIDNKDIINKWDNHYENMNSLINIILSDFFSMLFIYISLYFMNNKQIELIYMIASLLNMLLLVFIVSPVLNSIISLLMQGSSFLCIILKAKIIAEIERFNKEIKVENITFWRSSNINLNCK